MYAKLIVVGLIGAVLFLGYKHYTGLIEENKNYALTIDRQDLALQAKDHELEELRLQRVEAKMNMAILNEKLADERAKVEDVRKMFGDHDFGKLADKKPGLISIKMQRATQKLFDEIEAINND